VTSEQQASDGAPVGVLLLHGFTGSPLSVMPVADGFERAGFAVDAPLLPGHGVSPEELCETTFTDWVDAAESAYLALGERYRSVGVLGLSMGGALAADLAARHPEIVGAILINPFLEPVDPTFTDLLTAALASGSTVLPSIGSDIASPDHPPTGGIDTTPVRPLLSLIRGVDALAHELPKIKVPVLLFSSRYDHVVPTSTGEYLERSLRCPFERVMLERSYHVATLDYDGDVIVRRSVEFMERLKS
jgi:carboxylesterase